MKRFVKFFGGGLVCCIMTGLAVASCNEVEPESESIRPELEVNPDNVEAGFGRGTESVSVTSNVSWSISEGLDWISVSPQRGNGNKDITITIDENTDTESREGTISVKSEDGSLNRQITINQEGKEVVLSTDLSIVSLGGEANSRQNLYINSNVGWTLTGVPDWLNATAVSGNGNSSITLETVSANESASERNATLTITAGDKSVNVDVKQRGLLSAAAVVPINMVSLYYGVCYELEASGDVHSFYYKSIQESKIKRLTDKEIIRLLLQEEKCVFNDEYIISESIDEAEDGETYYICTIAFDQNEKQGELMKTMVEMPKYVDSDNDAWVSVEPVDYDGNYLWWQFTKQAYCHKYHAIMGGNIHEEEYIGSLFAAFEINYYQKYDKKHWLAENWGLSIVTSYPNNHSFSIFHMGSAPYDYSYAYAWGVFENGELSSDVLGGYLEIEAGTRSMMPKLVNKKKESKIISLSEVREKTAQVNKNL